jgi:hypothetical protein
MKKMYIKKAVLINLVIAIFLASSLQVLGSNFDDTTTLEISDIRGGIGGVTAYIENSGSVTANNFFITISITGGIFNQIDILKECGGCGGCGTTIAAGEIKSESTLESDFIIGFGTIDIIVTAEADNADLVSTETNGFVLGPLVLIF